MKIVKQESDFFKDIENVFWLMRDLKIQFEVDSQGRIHINRTGDSRDFVILDLEGSIHDQTSNIRELPPVFDYKIAINE